MATFASVARRKTTLPAAETPIAVVEQDLEILDRLLAALEKENGVRGFRSLDDLLSRTKIGSDPVVMVLGPSQMDEVVLDRASTLLHRNPSLGALLVVEEVDAVVLRIALRAGLDDAVALANVKEDLPQAVRELKLRLQSIRPVSAGPDTSAPKERRGRITTVFSPKGGVGKSVVSVNLATALARDESASVAVVDLDLNFGDVSVMLRLKPTHHIGEAFAAGARLDGVLIDSLLLHDDPTHLRVLAAPPGGTEGQRVTPEAVSTILAVMRSVADYVIVDTAPNLDDAVLQALMESDDIVYVVGMDVPSVKNARLGLQALELMGVALDRILLVLNRADSRVHLAQQDIERTLEMKVDASLPSAALVPQSVNTGKPAVLEFGRSRFAARIRDLAGLITDRAEVEQQQ